MSTTLTINGAVTLDESYSLQSSGTASGAEDNNDNDVSLSLMATEASSFYSRLFTGLSLSATFPTSNGVAKSASNFISTSGSGTVSNLGFVATAGAALPVYGSSSSGAASNLTAVDGGAISLFSDSVLGNKMVLGVDSKNQIVFAIFMQPNETFTSAAVWMVQFEAISHLITTNPDDAMSLTGLGVAADATMAFNFNALPSGQNLFGMVGNSATGLVVIGKTPALNSDGTFTNASNTINTSQGGGPTTIGVNNQMFDAGEGAYFTFVNNPVANYLAGAVNGLDQNEADDADNIQFGSRLEVNGASVTLSQVQGNEAVSLKITAFNGNNSLSGKAFATTGPSGGLGTGGPPITITQIIISDATGPIRTIDNPTAVNGAVTISNLQAGYTIAWKTSGLHDQVLIEGVTGKFDIGGFGVNQPSSSVTPLTGIRFEDDGPDVTLSLKSGQEVRVDESRGQNAGENEDASLGRVTVAGSVLFNTSAAFGQDGEGSSGYSLVLTLAQGASSADSGLKDTASNESVMLSKDGNDIVGRISGGVEVLRISIDTASGDITLTQYRAMKHGNPADHDEANSPLTIAAGLVYAQRAITDGDGDGDQEAADIGPAIKFEDDGPDVTLSLKSGQEVRVDESRGQNAGENEDASLGRVTVAGSVLFNTSAAFGQDGEGSSGYSLVLTLAQGASSADSGLKDTASNESVMLSKDGNDIVGRISGGVEVLRISIDTASGDITLTQYRAMKHGNPADHDEANSPLTIAAGLVYAQRAITDGDGDGDQEAADIGPAIKFEDDGPDVTLSLKSGQEVRVDESRGQNAGENEDASLGRVTVAGSVLFNTSAAFGQDGEGSSGYSLVLTLAQGASSADSGLKDTASNESVMLSKDGNDIVGRISGGVEVLRISIDTASGDITLTQYRAMKHGNPADHDEANSPLTIAAGLVYAQRAITDGDGDGDQEAADIGPAIKFEDDGPDVTLSLKSGQEVRVDESRGQNAGENEDASLGRVTVAGSVLFNTSAAFGQDGEGSSGYSLVLTLAQGASSADSGLKDTASNESVMLSKDGNDIVGRISGGVEVLRISIDTASGDITLTQYRAMKHGNPADHDEANSPLTIAAGLVYAQRAITDGDGDGDQEAADIGPAIKFEDDGPDVTLSLKSGQEVRVDESRGQNAGENEDASLGRVTVAGSVLFNTSAAFGQDGEGSSGYSLVLTLAQGASSADSGLKDTASNESVMLSKDGNDIVGRISGGVEVLRISIDTASGDITLTQYRAMKHGNPADHDEANSPLTIAAGLVYAQRAITDGDGDGDQEAADIGPAIKFEDDGPAIGPVANSVVDFIKNASVTKTLNGSVGSDAKVSPYVLYDDPNNPNDFTTSLTINGINLKAVFSAGNTVATYYADSNGDGVFGNGLDEAYYQLSLGQTGAGAYTFQVLKDPPPATVNFNFNDLPSGQNLFGMLGTSAAGLVVIGKKPVVSSDGTFTNTSNTINTSQGGGGTTIGVNNQMFDGASNANNQEGAYFTFVKNPNPNFLGSSLDANEADDADNMQFGSRLEVDNGFLRIVQVQGNTGVSLSLTAYNGTQPLYTPTGTNKFAGLGDGLTANFTSVVVVSGGIERVVPITGTGPVTVGGLKAGDIIKWKTDGLHDQVLVQALTGKFDIGGFGTTSGAPTPDQKLDFTVRVTDGDDDWSSASFSVGVDGTGIFDDNAVSGVSVTQTTNLMSTGEDSSLLLLGSTLMMESHHLNIT
jgi:hypothetical protein